MADCVVERDAAGNRKLKKKRSSGRIDGAVTLAMAIAAALAALGQGRVASAACEGLARNPAARPGIQIALFVGLAFIESLVLFTFLIIFVKVVK